MTDHAELLAALRRRPGVSYAVLTPNLLAATASWPSA
jgi:hypothetical protein